MAKLERDIVDPAKPILYKRYVDDVFTRKKKNIDDTLITKLNSYHKSIRFTVEKNLTKFLDTKINLINGEYHTTVNRNRKLPMNWSSEVPKKFKRNAINNDLHRANVISNNFTRETEIIQQKYRHADFPKPFIDSVIRQFEEKRNAPPVDKTEEEIQKPFIPINVPYCLKNEKSSFNFLRTLNRYTNNYYKFTIVWQTRKLRTLFKLKDKTNIQACVIYQGTCDNNQDIQYIGETKLISVIRWNQHDDPKHDSNPAKYLKNNPTHAFSWKVLCKSSTNTNKRKIHEALYIAKFKPSLNNQIYHKSLVLFKNGIT